MTRDLTYTAEHAKRELGVLGECAEIANGFLRAIIAPSDDQETIIGMARKYPIGLKMFGREFLELLECQFVLKLDGVERILSIARKDLPLFRFRCWTSIMDKFK